METKAGGGLPALMRQASMEAQTMDRYTEARREAVAMRQRAFANPFTRPTDLGHPDQYDLSIGWLPKVGPGHPRFVAVWVQEYHGLPAFPKPCPSHRIMEADIGNGVRVITVVAR